MKNWPQGKKRRNYEEAGLQEACVTWFRYQFPKHLIFSIPNGINVSHPVANRLKRTGLLAGVPDLFIPHPSNNSHGLFIELKSMKGTLKPEQKEIIDKLSEMNYEIRIVNSFEKFRDEINGYFNTPKPESPKPSSLVRVREEAFLKRSFANETRISKGED